MNGLTALLALDLVKLAVGESLAVSGGAGLLARYMIVLAKQRGLHVIADAKPSDTELVRGYGADVVVARGERFCSEVRAAVPGGVHALFDTALLGHDSFSVIRDGGAYLPVRGWDDGPSERGTRILPVLVTEVLDRTDWLSELRDLASSGTLTLRVAAGTRPSALPKPIAPWRLAACVAAASSSFDAVSSCARGCPFRRCGRNTRFCSRAKRSSRSPGGDRDDHRRVRR
jgi:NADPH2:quinone reductase